MPCCFQTREMSPEVVVHPGGAMIVKGRLMVEGGAVRNRLHRVNVNVNVMVHHQDLTRSVIKSVILVVDGVVVVTAVMIVSVTIVSVMTVPVMTVPVMTVPVKQVQVSSEPASSVGI